MWAPTWPRYFWGLRKAELFHRYLQNVHVTCRPGGGRLEDSGIFLRTRGYRSSDPASLRGRLQYWPLFLSCATRRFWALFSLGLSLLSSCPCLFHLSVLAVIWWLLVSALCVPGSWLYSCVPLSAFQLFLLPPRQVHVDLAGTRSSPRVRRLYLLS